MGVILVLGWRQFQDRDRSFLGMSSPEFPATGVWINSDGPQSLAKLRGKEVFL
jgi:hypothetical protein